MANYIKLEYMKYQKIISTNIKKLRLKNNLTQEEFSEKIGISLQGLSNIERNRYQPNAATIDKICQEFNITPVKLLIADTENNSDIIENIVTLLSVCSNKQLKQIYGIVDILVK